MTNNGHSIDVLLLVLIQSSLHKQWNFKGYICKGQGKYGMFPVYDEKETKIWKL